MKKNKYIIFVVFFFLSLNVRHVNADAFIINLYYDPGTKLLSFDKLALENVSLDKDTYISALEFAKQQAGGDYILNLYDASGANIVSTEFNKTDGVFRLTIPYFSLATKLKILEKSDNRVLLEAPLSKFSTCDGNGICEFEKGETFLTCLGDCGTSQPQFSPTTLEKLKENSGQIKDPATGEILLRDPSLTPVSNQPTPTTQKTSVFTYILLTAALAALIAIGWIIYKKIKNKDQ